MDATETKSFNEKIASTNLDNTELITTSAVETTSKISGPIVYECVLKYLGYSVPDFSKVEEWLESSIQADNIDECCSLLSINSGIGNEI